MIRHGKATFLLVKTTFLQVNSPIFVALIHHFCRFFFGTFVSQRTCGCRFRELDRSIEVDEGQWWQRIQSKSGGLEIYF